MMKYNVRIIKYGKKSVAYVPDFNDETLAVLIDFLSSEVINFPSSVKKALTTTIEKPDEKYGWAGNICTLSIEDGIASLDYQLDEMMLDEPLKLPVEELNELVLKWISDVKELKAKETK